MKYDYEVLCWNEIMSHTSTADTHLEVTQFWV